MKISWIKAKNDYKSFRVLQNLGFDVYELEEPETTEEQAPAEEGTITFDLTEETNEETKGEEKESEE